MSTADWLRRALPEPVKSALRPVVHLVRPPRRDPSAVNWFDAEDIDAMLAVYLQKLDLKGGPWEPYRDAHMRLPTWFRHDLDPWGREYAAQQHRLWSLISGRARPYEPEVDEREFGWDGVDPIRTPGFFARRDAEAVPSAADHVIASGMILQHAGLQPGDWALEYGAGFGHTALTLARLGVNVDTVDISAAFCGFVRAQAEHFGVPLTPFQARFGERPRPGQTYRLVWFYESFHHCVDFLDVVPRLGAMLAPGGRVILAGEPVFEREYAAVPYPWGVRLHSQVAVTMRHAGWFELGFSESFLFELFRRAGLAGRRVECAPSRFGRLYVFERL